MGFAPLFHHNPRWLNAGQNARSSVSPAFIKFLARVHDALTFTLMPFGYTS